MPVTAAARPAPETVEAFTLPAEAGELFGAAWESVALGERSTSRLDILGDAYAPVVDEVIAASGGRLQNPFDAAPAATVERRGLMRGTSLTEDTREARMAAFWAEASRLATADPQTYGHLPRDRAQFEEQAFASAAARRQELARTMARGEGASGTAATLAGGMASSMVDPVNVAASLFGAGGGTVLRVAAREALLNGAAETALQPFIAQNYEALGEEYTAETFMQNVGLATAGGFLLGGALAAGGKGASRLSEMNAGQLRNVFAPALEKLPQGLRDRWAAAPADTEPHDRLVADTMRATVDRADMTAEERGALDALDRAADVADANPFEGSGAAETHEERLAAALDAMLANARDPSATRRDAAIAANPYVEGEVSEFDSLIDFLIDDIEGGDELISDSGGLTKFGISQNAYPDLDIANLTREQAVALFKQDYWDAIGADRLAPDLAAAAFDAAVNHGVGKTRDLLSAANGDPVRFMALRRVEYARLAKANPAKYGGNVNGWENRLRKVENRLGVPRLKEGVADAGDYADPDFQRDAELAALLGVEGNPYAGPRGGEPERGPRFSTVIAQHLAELKARTGRTVRLDAEDAENMGVPRDMIWKRGQGAGQNGRGEVLRNPLLFASRHGGMDAVDVERLPLDELGDVIERNDWDMDGGEGPDGYAFGERASPEWIGEKLATDLQAGRDSDVRGGPDVERRWQSYHEWEAGREELLARIEVDDLDDEMLAEFAAREWAAIADANYPDVDFDEWSARQTEAARAGDPGPAMIERADDGSDTIFDDGPAAGAEGAGERGRDGAGGADGAGAPEPRAQQRQDGGGQSAAGRENAREVPAIAGTEPRLDAPEDADIVSALDSFEHDLRHQAEDFADVSFDLGDGTSRGAADILADIDAEAAMLKAVEDCA
ncbi:glycosyl hydrolase 108 family protein [Pacificimonas sp. ICDLI1SI03]